MRLSFGILGLLLPCSLSAMAQDMPHRGRALVIGNAGYTAYPALPACRGSSRAAAAALRQAGFEVRDIVDPSNAQMGEALGALGDKVAGQSGSRAVVYYCGYITPFADRLFLMPVDAQPERPSDVLTQGIVARLLMASVLAPASSAGLVLMDAIATPGQPSLVSFASMLRPADMAHGGLAAAELPSSAAIGPAAAALPAMLAASPDMGRELRALGARPEFARPGALALQLPESPSTLVDASPEAAPQGLPGRSRPVRPTRSAR